MYSELPGDIVFYVNGSPNNIYGIDMTTGWVRWRTPYTDDLWSSTNYSPEMANDFFNTSVWIILEDRREKEFIKKSINKFVF